MGILNYKFLYYLFFLQMELLQVELAVNEWNVVIEWLHELPFKKSKPIIDKIVECYKEKSQTVSIEETVIEEVVSDASSEDEKPQE